MKSEEERGQLEELQETIKTLGKIPLHSITLRDTHTHAHLMCVVGSVTCFGDKFTSCGILRFRLVI